MLVSRSELDGAVAINGATYNLARAIGTTTAKAIEIAATAIWVPIKNLRGSITSASAPAGAVSRNIGSVVATWTAETMSRLFRT